MNLPQLSKPQWDAACECARKVMAGDARCPADRAAYLNAKARLVDLLPEDEDANAIIKAAVRWNVRNDLAASLAMMPGARVEMVG